MSYYFLINVSDASFKGYVNNVVGLIKFINNNYCIALRSRTLLLNKVVELVGL